MYFLVHSLLLNIQTGKIHLTDLEIDHTLQLIKLQTKYGVILIICFLKKCYTNICCNEWTDKQTEILSDFNIAPTFRVGNNDK